MWQFAPEPSVALIPSQTSPNAWAFAYTSFGSAESGRVQLRRNSKVPFEQHLLQTGLGTALLVFVIGW